jgi:hypothetical protein
MSIAPDYCPQCLRLGVVATLAGPTCIHSERHGQDYWPADYSTWPDVRRLEYIRTLQERERLRREGKCQQ